jgi:NADH:ubiquinone oxidoreductase subunit K
MCVVVTVVPSVIFVGKFEENDRVSAPVVRAVSLNIVTVVTNVFNWDIVDVPRLTAKEVCFSVLSLVEVEDADVCVGTEDGKISTWVPVADEKLLVVGEAECVINVVPLENNVVLVFTIAEMLVPYNVDTCIVVNMVVFSISVGSEDAKVMRLFKVVVLPTEFTMGLAVVAGTKV